MEMRGTEREMEGRILPVKPKGNLTEFSCPSGAFDRTGVPAPALTVVSSGADLVIAEIQIGNPCFDPNRRTADYLPTVIALDIITSYDGSSPAP